ncbi:SWIM zinc finger family protein [Jeotgalibacillus soli]|uniref:SWIM-type domain-containing protein n=1 Tax=Jeotgalibacillus soli TaxID=889306 RepID=A0A0C2S6Y0_9BACL|nr:SWIM zinc finger family protein [Jeotgalibacillus soli]KIL49794.1 hypothetical protein KP78_12620 [Jeotgalibacillus soli]
MSISSPSFTSGMEQLEKKLFHQFHPSNQQDERLIQKGLFLYRQGTVTDTAYDPALHMVKAKVRDVYQVNVRISLDPEKTSSCSCPEEEWCRHRMAVFFKLYQQIASVGQWVNKWRNQKTVQLQSERSPAAWKKLVQRAAEPLNMNQLLAQPFLLEHYVANMRSTIQKQAPMEKEWKPLYELHTSLLLFIELTERIASVDRNALKNDEVVHVLEGLLDKMEDAMSDLSVYARPFAFDPFLEAMRKEASQLLDYESFPMALSVYSLLWFQLFTTKSWREKELDGLSSAGTEKENNFFARTALALLLMKNDLWKEQFRLSSPSIVPHAVRWMEWLLWDDRIEAAVTILKELPYKIPAFMDELSSDIEQRAFAHWLIRKLETGRIRMQSPEASIAIHEVLLPFSARHLGSLLLESGRYQEWVELVHWIGFQPEELEIAGFKQLIEKKPEYAVPLLHQWIDQLIAEKQRDSYRKAVRYLKKLKKIYIQRNLSSKWEMYFQAVLEKNRRLRAFQEECKRGHLIHVDQ